MTEIVFMLLVASLIGLMAWEEYCYIKKSQSKRKKRKNPNNR